MGTLLFANGRIWTGSGFVDAVAVRDGVITAAGPTSSVISDLSDFDVVDLDGRALVPGLQDAHIHPVQGALERLRCDLTAFHAKPGYLAAIAAYPGDGWITGGGWSMAAFPGGLPHRADLDTVTGDRPAFLPNRDRHGAWVNSRALTLAGIDRHTPDPADGRIERDPDGTPSGVLHEGAMDLVTAVIPADTAADYDLALLEAQRYLFGLGITGWQDAIVGAYAGGRDQFDTYLSADAAGALKARVTGALWWDRNTGGAQIELFRARRAAAVHGRFKATAVKIMQDGVAENFTASMLTPYVGHGGCGHSNVDPALLRGYVRQLAEAGFAVHFHAIGDRAVRECLDAVEGAPPGPRHHIAHLQVVHPDDVPRFGALGVTANIQALWATHHEQNDTLCVPYLGPERASWQYPFASIARAGGRLAAGSDWPVSTPNPWWAMHVAVNRTEPPVSAESAWHASQVPMLPDEALTLQQALRAYTAGSAYVNGTDDVTGTIEVGKAADLVVLHQDPFEPGVPLWEVTADHVFVDGALVHG